MSNLTLITQSILINSSRAERDESEGIYMPLSAYDGVAVTLLLIGTIIVFENALVIWVFITRKTLHTHMNIFVVHLAITDILMVFFSYPLVIFAAFHRFWLFGQVLCILEGFSVAFLGYSSIFILCAISVDRYIVICRQDLLHIQTNSVAIKANLVCSACALLWALLPLFGWGSYNLDGGDISCALDWQSKTPRNWTYNICVMFTCFLLPLGIIIMMYFKITSAVKSTRRFPTWCRQARQKRKQIQMEARLAKTVASMIVAFLLSWSPYAIVCCWALFGDASHIPKVATLIPAMFAKAAGIWNPIIYAVTNKHFRTAFFDVLPLLKLEIS
ncbi:hypothetical protein FSP39_004694 [Pinctada imbricata]|uniref:G-protein coupled receptors family 1 profile domain-containing protein n=1 Tax=Pinctada imbricata TaxID=66713 RepID=A0AA88XPU0_PINIB|nr:hypothetical protein FSP39_004694 [Pinctada imbricata]